LKMLGTKRATLQERQYKLEDKKERIIESYIEGNVTKEKRDQKLQEVKEEYNTLNLEIEETSLRIRRVRFDILRITKGIADKNLPPYDQYTQEQKREVVVEYILKATVEKAVEGGRKCIKISVELVRGGKVNYLYYYTLKDKAKQLKKV